MGTYSEFGLIVAQLAIRSGLLATEWLVAVALAVAISFVVAAPLNRAAHSLYQRLEPMLCRFELASRHPDDEPLRLGAACMVVMGMGRIGTGAYDALAARGYRVVGLDSDPGKVEKHRSEGRRVLYADAEDPGFWAYLSLEGVHSVLLTMPDLEARESASRQLRANGFRGCISTIAVFPEETEVLRAAGADTIFGLYDLAGPALAEHALESLLEPDREAAATG